jgi:hypothetical protein
LPTGRNIEQGLIETGRAIDVLALAAHQVECDKFKGWLGFQADRAASVRRAAAARRPGRSAGDALAQHYTAGPAEAARRERWSEPPAAHDVGDAIDRLPFPAALGVGRPVLDLRSVPDDQPDDAGGVTPGWSRGSRSAGTNRFR